MQERTKEIQENGFTDHVLVCTNERDSECATCAEAHGPAVYEAVQTWLRDRDVFWSHIYVAETSCLGLCSTDGTAITLHSRNRWYSDVQPDEVSALMADEFGEDGSRLGIEPGEPPDAALATDDQWR